MLKQKVQKSGSRKVSQAKTNILYKNDKVKIKERKKERKKKPKKLHLALSEKN
jgi:hypothetical protein